MSDNAKMQISCGSNFCTTLFIVFLVLKLTHTIDWSWWWVTAPLWIPIAMAIVLLLVLVITGILLNILPPNS